MERWTKQELEKLDDITFAILILQERRKTVTRYSPLGIKLDEAATTLHKMKNKGRNKNTN